MQQTKSAETTDNTQQQEDLSLKITAKFLANPTTDKDCYLSSDEDDLSSMDDTLEEDESDWEEGIIYFNIRPMCEL